MSDASNAESGFFEDIHELDKILQKTNARDDQCRTCGDSGKVWECHESEGCGNTWCPEIPCPDCSTPPSEP